jgi:quinol monooxygenase YgiN
MSDNVFWVLELAIKSGEMDNFKALMGDMVAATHDEPGALNYEWFISDDNETCHIYERFADSDAVLVHLGNFGANFAKRFVGCVRPTRQIVYGNLSDEARKAMKGMGAVHMAPIGGFTR